MKLLATLILASGAILVLVGCAAKTPTSAPNKQELAAPVTESHDHTEHAHTKVPVRIDAPLPSEPVGPPSESPESVAFVKAKPVFEKYCAKCHTEASGKRTALKHFVMDTYPFGGHHAASMPATVRKVLGQSGKRATMPKGKPGVIVGDELKLILEWADAAERAATGKQQPPDGHDHHHHH